MFWSTMIAVACGAALLASIGAASAAISPVIATGWDSPSPSQFREGLTVFGGWGVFDGTTLRATRRLPDGTEQGAIYAFSREKWAWQEFAPALADLKAAKPATCRENYLMLYSNPGDVDWFDDAGWREVTDHWRLLSRLARQGGLRGLLFDAEPYTPPHSQFLYRAQPEYGKHSFAEYRAKARQRGRQVMDAVRAEFPDAAIFSYRLFSDMLGLLDAGDLDRALEPHVYGLLPAFVDGWLDAMPSTMQVIEGTEDIGYRANSPAEYNSAFTRLTLRMPDFVAPENRAKVRSQFRVGQSLYLDAYVNPPGNPWHIDSTGSTPAARLAANLASALAASDGVVWLYGEKARWWPHGDLEYPMWPERLQGVVGAIRRAKDPTGFARDLFASSSVAPNLLENAGFDRSSSPDGPPAGWFEWQADSSRGRVTSTPGQVELSEVLEGCVGCSTTVQPGRTYAVRVLAKSTGRGLASLNIGWKTAGGSWTAHADRRHFVGDSAACDAAGWREIVGLVDVPSGAGQLIFMASVIGQTNAADRCWFKESAVVEVGQ